VNYVRIRFSYPPRYHSLHGCLDRVDTPKNKFMGVLSEMR
jgi:hypothetical protein